MKPRNIPLGPAHPERICWGCDHYCAASELRCGNGTIRTPHPAELFGPDWLEHGLDAEARHAGGMESSSTDEGARTSPKPRSSAA